jgi:predicted ATPase
VAGHLRSAFHGAVWFVPLQDLTDARLIPDKLLDALRLPRSPQLQPSEQAVAFLSRQPSLLLLDNFEHLVTDGTPLVQTLLEQVPALTCLVTSRQRLNLPGEREFPVAPLPVPRDGPWLAVADPTPSDPSDPPDPSDTNQQLSSLLECASVRLFVDRAQAARPDFQLTRTNAAAVATLCVRLEGLPLALELAAARAGVLAPAQMLERLSQRFELLASTQRGTVPRHRSLWAALDWSYELLSPELQQFFARLSVFQGGWTLEAAEAVCGDEGVGGSALGVGEGRSQRPTPNACPGLP